MQEFIKMYDLVDSWHLKNPDLFGFTCSNPCTKIRCRLDHLFVSKKLTHFIQDCKILPNIHTDHSAVVLSVLFDESGPPRGPGFWKFNNSLLSDTNYVELLCFKIPEFVKKHNEVQDIGLFWEMIKMEIRASTLKFSKRKMKQKRDEETTLLPQLLVLQTRLQEDLSDSVKNETERVKTKLAKIVASRTQGAIVRSRSRWYEQGERDSKYFYNPEKTNQWKKHVASLIKDDESKLMTQNRSSKKKKSFLKTYNRRKTWIPTTLSLPNSSKPRRF